MRFRQSCIRVVAGPIMPLASIILTLSPLPVFFPVWLLYFEEGLGTLFIFPYIKKLIFEAHFRKTRSSKKEKIKISTNSMLNISQH